MSLPACREPPEDSRSRRGAAEAPQHVAEPVPLRAVVFDFDGVIANSEPLHYQAFRDVLAAKALTLTEAEYYGRYLGYDDVGVFERFGRKSDASWSSGGGGD